MKFILLLLAISMQASAYSQLVTLNYKNAPLREVLKSIRQQTGYNFFIESPDLEKANPVTLTVKSESIDKALQVIFENQPFNYELLENTIIVKLKPDPSEAAKRNAHQQKQTELTGLVMDVKGKPLEGATVILKGTSVGAVTDKQGRFLITGAPAYGSLLIRMIGHETREVHYSDNNVVSITLREVYADMDEIQIIAYGEVSKKYNTSNAVTVKAKDIAKQPVSNPLLALEGRVPGLFIRQSSGVTSSTVAVNIQGINSLSNGSVPFYVVDDVPYTPQFTNYSLMGGSISGVGGSSFNFINPADIESITILKDADATAIYGSRAANGAILITTKKGKPGKTKVDVNIQSGWGKITRKLDLLNTQQYLEIRKESYVNAGLAVPNSSTTPVNSNYDLTVWDQNKYTDWQKKLVGGTAKYTNIQTSVSGGSLNTQFLASYGYIRETTVYPGNLADEKGNIHFNINHQSNDRKFSYSLSTSYLLDKNRLNALDLMDIAVSLAPNAPALYTSDGSINWEPFPTDPEKYSFSNPLAYVKQTYKGKTNNLIANNVVGYELLPGLNLKASAGFNFLQANEIKLTPLSFWKPDTFSFFKIRRADYLNKSITSWIIEPQITYNINTNFGNLDVLLGTTFQQSINDVLSQTGKGQTSDQQLDNLSAASTITINTIFKTDYKYNAIFGRLNYRLLDKYIININLRRDGSSRFGDQNKFHTFYSIGSAWLFGEEILVKDKFQWLSSGKLRVNYGTTGNDQINDYRYLSLLQSYTANASIPYLQTVGLTPTSIANPGLQWEETKKLNFGLDLSFFNNNIQLNLNYYHNRSSNQLIGYVVPSTTGFDNIDRNFSATIQNSGIESIFGANIIKRKSFSWQTSFNITFSKNKLIAFQGLENSTYANLYIIGEPINIRKVYKYAGVSPNSGLYEVYNSKGERTSNPDATTDKTQLIDLNPKFYGGWSNTFQYKGFDLDFLWQFTKQTANIYKFGSTPGFNSNQPLNILDRWRNFGDISGIQKISQGSDIFSPLDAVGNSNAAFGDASFLRLKNVSVSYSLPEKMMNKLHFSRAKIYAQSQNLITITNFIGTDPETQSINRLPPLKMFTLGLQFSL